jgi:hypothetical protein
VIFGKPDGVIKGLIGTDINPFRPQGFRPEDSLVDYSPAKTSATEIGMGAYRFQQGDPVHPVKPEGGKAENLPLLHNRQIQIRTVGRHGPHPGKGTFRGFLLNRIVLEITEGLSVRQGFLPVRKPRTVHQFQTGRQG